MLALAALGQGVQWKPGPGRAALDAAAELGVPAGLVYADGPQALLFLESTGNPPSGAERLVAGPPDLGWFAVFSVEGYETLGLVRPVDGKPDLASIRAAIERGSRSANRERARQGRETLAVLRFSEEPSWDEARGRVEWSLETRESGGRRVRNHFAYVLGPGQVIAAELVTPGPNRQALASFRALLDTAAFSSPVRVAPPIPGKKRSPLLAASAVALIVVLGAILLLTQSLRKGTTPS